jgi:cytochrome oxidase Cu insertion factor (SCO1/SenC/PrrC family)
MLFMQLVRSAAPLAATVAAVGMFSSVPMNAVPKEQAASSAAEIEVTKAGPQIGQKVPDFTLPDQNGRARTLSSLIGAKGLVLVFSRSADW